MAVRDEETERQRDEVGEIRAIFLPLRLSVSPSLRLSVTSPRAFTLIELMISLAMVLILILGINYVFRSATDAVGAGQALNGINSDAQSAQPVFFTDVQTNVARNPPCFIITSQLVTQFLNADDAKTSSDPAIMPTDNNGNYNFIANPLSYTTPKFMANKPLSIISPAILNSRNHRADMLKFFAHGNYHRRSGNDGTYYGTESSDDAFIEYGHAALPANDLSNFYGPSSLPASGQGYTPYTDQNPTITPVQGVPRVGAFASDWVLIRRVTLLKPANSIAAGDIYYSNPPTQYPGLSGTGVNEMAPLAYGSKDNNNPLTAPPTLIQSSRYDLAGITPEAYDQEISSAILAWANGGFGGTTGAASLWWNPLVYAFQLAQTIHSPPQWYLPNGSTLNPPNYYPPMTFYFQPAAPTFQYYAGGGTNLALKPNVIPGFLDPSQWYSRPQCNPLVQTPVNAAAIAQMAPYFLQHCSQFIVEYAGDYMQQNPANGAMTGLGPDGQIDYYLDTNGNRHIRWYGMPRSTTGVLHPGDATAGHPWVLIRGFDPTDGGSGTADDPTVAGNLNYFTDVIPLRDYYTMWAASQIGGSINLNGPSWEPDVNFAPTRDYGNPAAYPGTKTDSRSGYALPSPQIPQFGDAANPSRYVAAWHDDMPAMIRILIKVDDPNNKVKDGPWYEYVFKLK